MPIRKDLRRTTLRIVMGWRWIKEDFLTITFFCFLAVELRSTHEKMEQRFRYDLRYCGLCSVRRDCLLRFRFI